MQHETYQETFVAAIYSRSAMECQTARTSIEGQVRACLELIESKHWTVAKDFIVTDDAMPGTHISPALIELLSAAKQNPGAFRYIVIDDTSVLSRSLSEILKLAEDLYYRGVFLYFVAQKLDSRNYNTFRQMLTMYVMVADQFLAKLSQTVHRGMRVKVLNGMSAGGSCFAYRGVPIEHETLLGAEGHPLVLGYRLEIFEPEAEVVRRIFDWSGASLSLTSIARQCNSEGLPRPAARVPWWSASSIHSILSNDRYLGKITWNRTMSVTDPPSGALLRKPRPQSEWLIVNAPELRVVSDEQWERAHLETVRAKKLG